MVTLQEIFEAGIKGLKFIRKLLMDDYERYLEEKKDSNKIDGGSLRLLKKKLKKMQGASEKYSDLIDQMVDKVAEATDDESLKEYLIFSVNIYENIISTFEFLGEYLPFSELSLLLNLDNFKKFWEKTVIPINKLTKSSFLARIYLDIASIIRDTIEPIPLDLVKDREMIKRYLKKSIIYCENTDLLLSKDENLTDFEKKELTSASKECLDAVNRILSQLEAQTSTH